MSKHIFALYYPYSFEGKQSICRDSDIIQRCERVLRLQEGEELILFNDTHYTPARITAIKKKEIHFSLESMHLIGALLPAITYLLPLQEKDQWEEALYKFAVLGVTTIVPVITENSRTSWGAPKDYERAHRIFIAAAEQSKQFKLPQLVRVQRLESALTEYSSSHNICFDAQGEKLVALLPQFTQTTSFTLVTGPEAGFSDKEFALLDQHNFKKISLVTSILKASHAATLAVGCIRSLI